MQADNHSKRTWPAVGWIGTGVMGQSMCGHLLRAGVSLSVHNRSPEKAAALLSAGASWAATPAAAALQKEIVFTMLGFPADVRDVFLSDGGLIDTAAPGTILVDMTSSEPSLAKEIAQRAQLRGLQSLDAPVSGGDVGARNATLVIMVGGDVAPFERVKPLLECLGRTIVRHGPSGAGQHVKLCNQIVVAGTMIGMCESLLYGHAAGLDLEQMLGVIRGGAAACWSLDNLAPRVLRRDFEPGFYVKHFIKDMGIALQEARAMNLALPGLALVQQLYLAVQAAGGAQLGTQALMLALERLSARI